MKVFYDIGELRTTRQTKGELSEQLYPGELFTVDCAIPQTWLDMAWSRGMDKYCEGSNLAGHFVTVYPKDGSPGYIAPITLEGVRIMARLASTVE